MREVRTYESKRFPAPSQGESSDSEAYGSLFRAWASCMRGVKRGGEWRLDRGVLDLDLEDLEDFAVEDWEDMDSQGGF
jgi:hypothetical protein